MALPSSSPQPPQDLKESASLLEESLGEIRDLKAALDEHAIVAVTDPQGDVLFENDKLCALSKYSREKLPGQDRRILNPGFHPKEFFRDMWDTIGRGEVWKGAVKNRANDGSFCWMDSTDVPIGVPGC